jgi:effector-binding domain-containing protein
MKLNSEVENQSLDMDLNFIKPWKSFAKVGFEIKPKGEGTDVSWTMASSLPFFLFWMKKQVEAYVGMDYERGLKMLKDLAEDGKVHSELTLKGKGSFDGGKYIGIKGSCSIDEMGEDMNKKMEELTAFIHENKVEMAGEAFSIYHKWNMVNRQAEYTTGFFVKETPAAVSGSFVIGEIPKVAANIVEHKGAYEHLGNAWGLQYMMQRGKEFKANKKVDPFEVYKNSPGDTAKPDLLTEVYFATK